MKRCVRCRKQLLYPVQPIAFAGSDEVDHGGRAQKLGGAEGQSADRPHLLFELRTQAGIDGGVSGIVRPRRQFVDEHAAVAGSESQPGQEAQA